LERDLHGGAGGEVPIAPLQQWVNENAVEAITVSGLEVAIDEHDVGDEHLMEIAETKVGSAALDGCRTWIGLNWTEGQTMPGDHRGDCREGPSGAGKFVLLVWRTNVVVERWLERGSCLACIALLLVLHLWFTRSCTSRLCGFAAAAAMMSVWRIRAPNQ